MIYGYVRVSTDMQDVETQTDALVKAGVPEENIYKDVISGSSTSRDGLNKLLSLLRKGDRLTVWKLDRLGRKAGHLMILLDDLMEQEIEFESLQEGFETKTPYGRAMMRFLGVFAELEREVISDRTKAALAYKKQQGVQLGRPCTIDPAIKKKIARRVAEGVSCRKVANEFGVSIATVSRVSNGNV